MNFQISLTVLLVITTTVNSTLTDITDKTGYIPGHDCLRSYDGMMESVDDLVQAFPSLVTKTKIGESWLKNNEGRHDGVHDIPDGGHDIFVLNITASDSERLSSDKGKMLLTSGVHAREYAPPELLMRFIELLVKGYGHDADVTTTLQHSEVHAILYINPDGRFMAEKYPELYWRKNLHPYDCEGEVGYEEGAINGTYGVDINRNMDFMFANEGGSSEDPCKGSFHGSSPESEPESQALMNYARALFPEEQRKSDAENQLNEPLGEDISDMFIDIHSHGGYVYYPWGYEDLKSPDDDALQALGRKINYFNGYRLWAGGQPDFLYPASGDISDYMYGSLGVSALGFEIGSAFYQSCDEFERLVAPVNLPALLFAAKNVNKPFSLIKGPDVFDLRIKHVEGGDIRVTAHASDSKMVNKIAEDDRDFEEHTTGLQSITELRLFIDVHPDNIKEEDDNVVVSYTMKLGRVLDDYTETYDLVLDASTLTPGRHTFHLQAIDSELYKGPVSSIFVDVTETETSDTVRRDVTELVDITEVAMNRGRLRGSQF